MAWQLKRLLFVILLLTGTAQADSLRYVEGNVFRMDANGFHVDVSAPDLLSTNRILKWPNSNGNPGQFMSTDGSGNLSWASTPWAVPGTIGSGTPNSAVFTTTLTTGKVVAYESADFTTGGFLFSESGTDTGYTSPGDGVIYQYGNSSIGSKWDSNGISEMRGVPLLFPNTQGAAASVLTNNGSGILSWTAGTPWATPGAIGATTPNSGVFTTLTSNGKILVAETPDYTTGGVLGSESGNDTGLVFSSDGIMDFYGNSVLGMRVSSNGPFQINGVPLIFPSSQGALNNVLSNDGNGNLFWATGGGGNLNINETFDPDDNSSNRNTVSSNFTPVADSSNSNLTELFVSVSDNSAFALNGYTLLAASGQSDGSADKSYIAGVNLNQTIGNGADAQTVGQFTGFSTGLNLRSNAILSGYKGMSLGINADAGSSITNYQSVYEASNLDLVANYSGFEIQSNIAHLTNNFFGFSVNGNHGTFDSGIWGFHFSPNITSVNNNVTPFDIGGTWGTVGGVIVLNDGPSITTQTNNYVGLNSHPNIGTSSGYIGSTLNPTITTSSNYSGVRNNPSIGTFTNYAVAFEDGTNVATSAIDYHSIDLHPNIPLLTNNFKGMAVSPNVVGDGNGDAVGVYINMQQVTNFGDGNVKALQTEGNVNINGRLNAGLNVPVVDNGGNPAPVNTMNSTYQAPASATIANVDSFGFGPIMTVQVGAGSTLTSGGFGLGLASLGMINLLMMDTGSSLDYTTGSFVGMILPSGDGHIDNMIAYRAIVGNFGATTTVDNAYLFKADLPLGNPATNAWGFYASDSSLKNWMSGSLKIGGTAGSTDRVSAAGVSLETDHRALFNEGVDIHTTTTKPTCDATVRGTMWVDQGGAGVTDEAFICLKSTADTYNWISIVTGG